MRAEIRLLAEGLGAFRERVDRLEQNLREDILRAQRAARRRWRCGYAVSRRRAE
jgi:hypothetical protein